MELGWGLLVPATGARADVVVRADAGTLFGEVESELRRQVVPVGAAGRWSVDGTEVDPTWPVGQRPLLHGALLCLDAATPRVATVHQQVHVVGGPLAGRVLRLPHGQVVLGRDPAGPGAIDDPQVSRAHCCLEIGASGVVVQDLDSTNGTELDGVPVLSRARWRPGAVLRIGDSRLVLAEPAPGLLPVLSTGDGRLAVNRPPRLRPDPRLVQVVVPHPPAERERSAVPVLAVLVPMLLAVVVWRLTGNAMFLLFTLLSPVVVLGSVVTERRNGKRLSRRDRTRYTAARTVAELALEAAVRADEQARRTQWPDAAALHRAATGPGHRLWERGRPDQDALHLRLGIGDLPAHVDADGDVTLAQTSARDVPVVVPLRDVGVLGVCGPHAGALARWVVVQTAVLHSPRDLSIVVLGPIQHWRSVRYLPHVAPRRQNCRALVGTDADQAAVRVAELLTELDARQAERDVSCRPEVLVVVDGARLRAVPGLARLLAEGPAVGIVALCVNDDPLQLPTECRAIARTPSPAGCSLTLSRNGHADVHGTADLVSEHYAETVARSLGPLVDASAGIGDTLPAGVRWTELVDLALEGTDDDAALVAARWATSPRSTRAPLGRGAAGPVEIDLVADGPHALVAGTTGSGKSELLQTLIASWALANRPDELVMVLVDYKGGAAFGPCEHLPHVVGLVTDLDAALVERALSSLHAELARRETVLRSAGAKDLDDHRLQAQPGQLLPRLLLVVDEFASLAEELPGFVAGLVGVAMRGRSLGVHLVLATQRPEGVVSADIRANTNLRICLAVTRDSESRDVVDSPLAASISRMTPGRALVRTGHAELTMVQSARVGGRHRRRDPTASGPTVELNPASELGSARVAAPTDDPEYTRTDLDLLVTACQGATERLQIDPGRSPWLAPLPGVVLLPARSPGSALRFGVVDVPAQQTRRPLELDLATGTHLLVIGSARSGRTTVLRALAGAAATTLSPDDLHLYALDLGGGGLAALDCLPHTGAVVGADEPARQARVLDWLGEQVVHRQPVLAEAGHADLREHRAAVPPEQRLPHLLLLLDRWEAFLAAYQDLDGGRLVDQVLRLLREGPAVGLHVVVTGDRSALVGRLASAVPQRLLLRMADPADYAVAGLPSRLVPESICPGRGWTLDGEPLVAQVALLDADPGGPAQIAALRRLAAAAPPAARPPHRIGRLPDVVHLAELPTDATLSRATVLGVGGDGPDPVHLDLARSPGLVVGGPPRSGRSSTLLTLAYGAHGLRTVALAPRPSPLRTLTGCLTRPDDPEALQAALGEGPALLLVDDAEALVDSPVGLLLEDLLREPRGRGLVVVAAGATGEMSSGYRGFVVALRRARNGLLLSPESAADGDLLGVRLPRSTGGPLHRGRGLLVDRDRVRPIQVALPCR